MKPNITFDFVRGILFSYVVYHIYSVASAVLLGSLFFPEGLRTIGIISATFSFIIYLAIAFALLFTPKRFARFVTIFLSILLIVKITIALIWTQYLPPGMPSPFNRFLISQLIIGAFMVALSFLLQSTVGRKNTEQDA